MTQRDYYSVLNVPRDAEQQQIKDSYRALALKYHPDRNKADSAAAVMKEINESYAVLSDPEKRRQYDSLHTRYGSAAYDRFRRDYSDRDIFRGSDVDRIFEELSRASGLRGSSELFHEWYGPHFRSFEFKRRGVHARGYIFHSFGRRSGARTGSTTGTLDRLMRHALPGGRRQTHPRKGRDLRDTITVSPALARTGGKVRYECRLKSKELLVSIPAGLNPGQRIRLRGMGGEGAAGGPSGDLLIRVRVRARWLQSLRDLTAGLFRT